MPECDVLTELKAKTLALDARRKEVEALQRDLAALQGSINARVQQASCHEADILELKRSLKADSELPSSQEEAFRAPVRMPEAEAIQTAF